MDYQKEIQDDLDAGKFGQICSNETTFKAYVLPLIARAVEAEKERIKSNMASSAHPYCECNHGLNAYDWLIKMIDKK